MLQHNFDETLTIKQLQLTIHHSQFLFWIAIACFNHLIWLNYDYGPSFTQLLSQYGLGLVVSYGLLVFYTRATERSLKVQLMLSVILTLPFAMLWRVTINYINLIYFVPESFEIPSGYYLHNTPSSYLLLLAWSTGYWLVNYHRKFVTQKEHLYRVELEAQQAQLKMLRFQINPHFLFNVLTTIDTLILRKDYRTSRRVLGKISEYLRATLDGEEKESHTLKQEFELLNLYISIEKERFGERLEYAFPDKLLYPNLEVPRHFLQPLMENAIKHGIARLPAGGEITLTLTEQQHQLVVSLKNPTPKIEAATDGFKLGVKNVQQRLETFFGARAYCNIVESEGLFCINLYLPVSSHDN